MMKPSPWNVNLANSEKRHNGLTCNSQGSPYQILGKWTMGNITPTWGLEHK